MKPTYSSSNRTLSLLLAVFGFCLFGSFLYFGNISQRIIKGENAQLAIQQLDAMRRPILAIKALENKVQRHGDYQKTLFELDKLESKGETILKTYLELANYKPELLIEVKQFADIYHKWLGQERWMLNHLEQSKSETHHVLLHYMETDHLMLTALSALGKGESFLHEDIHIGQRTEGYAAIAAVVLLTYLLLLIIVFQYLSARQLAKREQDLDITLHSIGDAVITTDAQGNIVRMNPVAEDLTGWQLDEVYGQPMNKVFVIEHATTGHTVTNPVEIVLEKGHVVGLANHTVLLSRDGRRYQIADSAAPIKKADGSIRGVVLVFHDVTANYDMQKRVSEQATRLNNIIKTSMDAIIASDENGAILEWNTQAENTFGWSREEILGKFLHKTIIPHQYRKQHLSGIEHLKNTGQANLLNERMEVTALHKNGKEIPVELTITQMAESENFFFSAFIRDQSEIKATQQELKLVATSFHSHSGIVITDCNKLILRINPAMEKMTGYHAEEMIGEYPSMLKSERQDELFYKKMWQLIAETGNWQGELWNKRKDGSLYAEFLNITAVKDSLGRVVNYVGTSYDISERKIAEEKIEQLAYYDELTNLANRRLLLDRINHELIVAKRHNNYGALLYLDLDRFKNLNDALGHPVGDELLRQLAQRLTGLVRAEDTVSRLGGDEFVIMLPATHESVKKISLEASNVAKKVKKYLSEAFDLHGYKYFLSTSIGIVIFPEDGEIADDILKHADSALYHAKDEGRNTARFYRPAMQQDADTRLQLEKDLRHALENNELILHYQPQVDANGHIIGAEALVRWLHPQRGMIPPGEFIPLAEDTGLILDLGNWVLQQAGQQVAQWHAMGICPNSRALAINVSPRQFHQENFLENILNMISTLGIEAGCIELEITENLLMEHISDVIDKLTQLRTHGIRIAIDDFGTGYSSLSYLKTLPLDKLKIDQSFVRDIGTDKDDAAIVDTIIAMSSHLGLDVIAEGVETQQQLDFLLANGCKTFQGYFFSKPVSSEQMTEILTNGLK